MSRNFWIDGTQKTPEEDKMVLVIASGEGRNVELFNAICLATYHSNGWLIEEFPEIEEPVIKYWAHIPVEPVDILLENMEWEERMVRR